MFGVLLHDTYSPNIILSGLGLGLGITLTLQSLVNISKKSRMYEIAWMNSELKYWHLLLQHYLPDKWNPIESNSDYFEDKLYVLF